MKGPRSRFALVTNKLSGRSQTMSWYIPYRRHASSSSSTGHPPAASHAGSGQQGYAAEHPPLSIMPATLLMRSYFITSMLASPRILRLALPIMNKIANSESRLLNPDKNPVLHFLVRKLVYDHFTAGETATEVKKTVADMKSIGFKGVILGYAKEVSVTGGKSGFELAHLTAEDASESTIREWKEGTLKTLGMIGEGDILAVKYSGAGLSTLEALRCGHSPPPQMWAAMHEICAAVVKQKSRMWIDAEQQDLQGTIDNWTIDLMRKYNRSETVVYTTMQAYLKHMEDNIERHLKLAQNEGWILGIKLVRGAYIATEKRQLIHNTIQDTHTAYDRIVENLLRQTYPGIPTDKPYPLVSLFLASHNDESIKKAYEMQKAITVAGQTTIEIGYGQLQGMADEVSCGLLQLCQAVQPEEADPSQLALAPRAFKCLTYGSTQECLQFLLRRVRENADALGRTEYWLAGFRNELWRRFRSLVSSA